MRGFSRDTARRAILTTVVADTASDEAAFAGEGIAVVEGEAIEALRPLYAFPNALPSRPIPTRPDMIAVTATAGGGVVACAAASDENDLLWQIGVDMLAPCRGRSVVGRLTEAILDAGKVPYYSHTISNIRSTALATSLGSWPAWVQWHALEFR